MGKLPINKIRMSENLLYGLIWSIIILVPMLNAAMTSIESLYLVDVLSAWSKTAPYFIIFLLHNRFLSPLLLQNKNYVIYIFLSLALIITTFIFVDYAQEYLLPTLDITRLDDNRPKEFGEVAFTTLNVMWNALLSICMFFANTAIKLVYKSIRDDQAMAELTKQNMQVEMDYLKYQINPHFFMNTLNNIHALIDIDTESAKSTVIELSKMMRYILYDSGSESISLRNDLQFLNNYITLMKIRYGGDVSIRTNYPAKIPQGVAIPPLLFIVFVENAFKHGISDDSGSFIHIDITFEEGDKLSCKVENSMPNRGAEKYPAGIGLENVRRRLELIYGDKFTLLSSSDYKRYTTLLTIPITQNT